MTLIVHDTFAGGSDGDDIQNRPPDAVNTPGDTWEDSATNTIELDGAGGVKWAALGNSARINAATVDCMAIGEFNPGGVNNRFNVGMRSNDVNAGAGTQDYYRAAFNTSLDNIIIASLVNGTVITTMETIAFTIDESTTYFFGVSADGDQIQAYGGTSYPPAAIGAGPYTNTDVDGTTVGGTYCQIQGSTRTDAAGRLLSFRVDDLIVAGGNPWNYYRQAA